LRDLKLEMTCLQSISDAKDKIIIELQDSIGRLEASVDAT